MRLRKTLLTAMVLVLISIPYIAQAADGNWKRGRIYYRMVCTSCHVDKAGGAISPATKTIAEWTTYMEADKHAKSTDKLSYYVSKDYRNSIKASNKAAAKFIKLPDEKLFADVKAFVIHGASDSDNPARCN